MSRRIRVSALSFRPLLLNIVLVGTVLIGNLAASSQYAYAENLRLEPSARFRFQQIDDDQRGDATASTLKLRLSSTWQAADDVIVFAQGDHVEAFNDSYNSVTVQNSTSPIPDVAGSELNQLWLQYSFSEQWQLQIGRQIVNLNNERHISSVEFWQNDQTFDALSIRYSDSTNWNIYYAYVSKVHRIFGDDAGTILPDNDPRFDNNPQRPFLELGNHEHNTHLLNVSYRAGHYLELTGFAYLIDNKTAKQLSSNTFGIRANGEYKPNNIKYGYAFELAQQDTLNDSPWDFSGLYYFAQLSAQYKSHSLAIAHEVLGENNGFAFATSLGNNHKFLGWADIFSGYLNNDGIEDTFISYRGRKARLRWQLIAHQYNSESTGVDIGRELDVEVAYRFDREWQAQLLLSRYVADEGLEGLAASSQDLSSATLSISYKF